MNGSIRMHTAVGGMHLNPNVLSILRQLKEDSVAVNAESLKEASRILEKAPEILIQSPRQWNADCNALRTLILYFLQCDLEQRYGEMEFPDKTYAVPFYAWEREAAGMPATGVVSFSEDSVLKDIYDFGLCIGWRFDAWDQFFYQAAMGAVFLLNPRIGPRGSVTTSTLEAGVAIRYAEEMLDKYLPYTPRQRVESPVGQGNNYDRAYQAARKIPDAVLHQVRDTFGSFGNITDQAHFYSMTSQWISAEDARLLSSWVVSRKKRHRRPLYLRSGGVRLHDVSGDNQQCQLGLHNSRLMPQEHQAPHSLHLPAIPCGMLRSSGCRQVYPPNDHKSSPCRCTEHKPDKGYHYSAVSPGFVFRSQLLSSLSSSTSQSGAVSARY